MGAPLQTPLLRRHSAFVPTSILLSRFCRLAWFAYHCNVRLIDVCMCNVWLFESATRAWETEKLDSLF